MKEEYYRSFKNISHSFGSQKNLKSILIFSYQHYGMTRVVTEQTQKTGKT